MDAVIGQSGLEAAYDDPVSYTHLDVYKRQLRQYRIILSADTASEVRQLLSQKRR